MHTGPSLVIHPLNELMLDGGESFHCHLTLWMVMHLSQTGACWHFLFFLHFGDQLLLFFWLEVVFKGPWSEEVVYKLTIVGLAGGNIPQWEKTGLGPGDFYSLDRNLCLNVFGTFFFLWYRPFPCNVEPCKRYKCGSILLVSNLEKSSLICGI